MKLWDKESLVYSPTPTKTTEKYMKRVSWLLPPLVFAKIHNNCYTHNIMTKQRLYQIIFKTDTKAGRLFDEILLVLIFLGTISVILMSVPETMAEYWVILNRTSVVITILFGIEYVIRILVHPKPKEYIFSFFGFVDLAAIIPWIARWSIAWHNLLMIRSMRLLRLFRVFNLWTYESAWAVLWESLLFSRNKIIVFLLSVTVIVCIVGTLMYLIEWEVSWFDSIPMSIYWSIVTITTVWYGDITPLTPLGKSVSALLMLLWYGIIAIPTGLVSAEMAIQKQKRAEIRAKKKMKKKKSIR